MSAAAATLVTARPQAAPLPRYRLLPAKTVPALCIIPAVLKPAPNRAKKTVTGLASVPPNAVVDVRADKMRNGSCITSCSLPVCKDKVTSKPANSYYTTSSCTDCSGSHTINSGWRCNIGYTQSGNSCISASHCQPPMHDLTCNGRVYCCPAGVYDCKEATGGTGPGGMIMPSKCWTDATTPFG